jgi:hypothetical protein
MPVPIGLAVTRARHGNFRQTYRSFSTEVSLPWTVVFMPVEAKALNFHRGDTFAGSPRQHEEVLSLGRRATVRAVRAVWTRYHFGK